MSGGTDDGRLDLEQDLAWAAARPLTKAYLQADGDDAANHPTLARVIRNIVGDERWQARPNLSLIDTLRDAIQQIPETMTGRAQKKQFGKSWWKGSPERRMAEIMYGYRNSEVPARFLDGALAPKCYDKDFLPAALALTGQKPNKSGARSVTRVIREDIAVALLEMESEALTRVSSPTSKIESKPIQNATRKHSSPSREEAAPPTSDTPSEPPRKTRWPRPVQLTVALTATVAVVAGAVVGTRFLSGDGSGAAGSSTTTSNRTPTGVPPLVSAASGPVAIDSVAYIRDGAGPIGWSYVFPQKLTPVDLASLNKTDQDYTGYQNWVLTHGGINPSDAKTQIVLRGNSVHKVVITDMQVEKSCQEPARGTMLYSPPAGPNGDIQLSVDLDDQFPVIRSTGSDSYFVGHQPHTISLAHGETQTLLVDARASKWCHYSFYLIVSPGDGGSPVREKIDYNGQQFQVSPLGGYVQYQEVAAGGVASPKRDDSFVPVDPATYNGG